MDSSTLLPSLSIMTLVAFLAILIVGFLYSMRSRRNREAAKRIHGLKD